MILPNNLDKLSGLFPSVGTTTPTTANNEKVRPEGMSAGQGLTTDTTELSSAASQVLHSIRNSSADSDVRTDKVAAVAAAIQNGTYSVPADAVAKKVIDSMTESGK